MKKRIIFATGNAGKMKEIKSIFSDFDGDNLGIRGRAVVSACP